ncbi:hypothetical protein AB4Z10_29135 [Bosea sp. RAF48]|uniref:hypothetical protein n=1 Tax=Bosea sp. RAF48 TaxID=3237480 RepID=UPI003F8EB5CE
MVPVREGFKQTDAEARAYPTGDIEGSVGFALGLIGMTVCDAVIRWARRWRDGPPSIPMPPKSSG